MTVLRYQRFTVKLTHAQKNWEPSGDLIPQVSVSCLP